MTDSDAARTGAADGITDGSGFRRCLRPATCPFAERCVPLVSAERWGRHLRAAFPGDPALAIEIAAALGHRILSQERC